MHSVPLTPAVASDRPSSSLSFCIRAVTTAAELEAVVALRARAYGERRPELGAALAAPEPDDHQPDCTVLAAFDKATGEVLATMRIHRNTQRPLPLEASVELPAALASRRLVEVTRLARQHAADPMVKLVLFKALYHWCVARGVEVIVVAGRSPLDQQYAALLFDDVFPDGRYVPMQHAGGLPHRILALDIAGSFARWTAAAHPLLHFMIGIDHPDIVDGGEPVR